MFPPTPQTNMTKFHEAIKFSTVYSILVSLLVYIDGLEPKKDKPPKMIMLVVYDMCLGQAVGCPGKKWYCCLSVSEMLLPFDHPPTPWRHVFFKAIKLNTEAWGILLGHATGFAAKNACSIMQQAWVPRGLKSLLSRCAVIRKHPQYPPWN